MKRLALILSLLAAMPAMAVQPDEVLDDPALEERARDLSAGLRCVVCRNESIDESRAEIARDMRLLVRERLLAGDSNAEVIAYMTERYGEYILLRPQMNGANLVLWAAPLALLLAGLGVGFIYIRSRRQGEDPSETAALAPDEAQRLQRLMKE